MQINFEKKCGDKLYSLLAEIDFLISSGSIPVGVFGLSPDSAEFCRKFCKLIDQDAKKIYFTDKGLK